MRSGQLPGKACPAADVRFAAGPRALELDAALAPDNIRPAEDAGLLTRGLRHGKARGAAQDRRASVLLGSAVLAGSMRPG